MLGGTITFLFTDVEGSTRRWASGREAMAEALRRHDALVGGTIRSHGGEVFKTIGDAFCSAFATASEALAAALAAQHALGAEDFSAVDGIRVRMAVHTGTADQRDGDFFGPAVNRVARLLAAGHGGQVLVSAAGAELLHGEMPPHCGLRDLGSHRLKDLARPERLYQLEAPGLRADFPPPNTLDAFPNNLPLQPTSFVGREDDVDRLKALLLEHRLVTLVASGGAGKTRCAIQAGAEMLDAYADGVWLVELAPISRLAPVAAAVAQALGVRESPDAALLDTLLAHLKYRRVLLLLDNCEHVMDDARALSSAVLRACPEVRLLATSRESLNIAGERLYRLPSLAVPPTRELSPEAALQYGAVALFADRAAASNGRFTLTDENAPFVTEIAARLDGIPLAIELAAARIKVLAPAQLAQKLDERFRVLTGGDRSALPRHQTMRALIDWSYDLLADPERALFRKLSIFAGGFTLEAATAVCGDEQLDEMAVLELLTSLIDKSLVQADPFGGLTRYRLLESTRQYAREKLLESGAFREVALAHAAAFLSLAQRIEDAYDTTPDRQWFAQIEPEMENWRAALEWSLTARGNVLLGQRLTVALGRGWALLLAAQGRRWIQAAQACVDASTPPELAAELDLKEAQLDGVLGLHKGSLAAAQRALAKYHALRDPFGVAQSQRNAGRGLLFTGRVAEGEELLREALAAFRALGAHALAGAALENLGIARKASGDIGAARAFFADALEIFKACGAERLAVSVGNNLAEMEFSAGNAAAALQIAEETLNDDRSGISAYRVALRLCNMAAYLIALGRYGEARARARDALLAARRVHYEAAQLWAIHHLAAIAALRDGGAERASEDRRRAARLLAHVEARLRRLETLREYTEQQEYERLTRSLEEIFCPAELAALTKEGAAFTEDRAVAEALAV